MVEPNWNDFRKNAKNSGEEAFDEGAFEDASSSDGNNQEKANAEKNRERQEAIDDLFVFYRKLVSANHPDDVFGRLNRTLPKDKQLNALKKSFRVLAMKYNADKFNSALSSDESFPKEVEAIANKVAMLLNSFYDEATIRVKNGHVNFAKEESARRNNQATAGFKMDEEIKAAKAAEQARNDSNGSGAKNQAENESNQNKKEQQEKTENEEADSAAGNENDQQERAEKGAADEATENVNESPNVNENSETVIDPSRGERISKMREELELIRKEYLEVDYKKNTAWKRMGKFFGNIGKHEDNLENDQDIAWFRAHYDNKLFDLQNELIEEARERGASDKELADIFLEFKVEQKITMAAEHDKVKTEQQDGRAWGFVKEKMLQISDEYKSLPTWKKLLIGGGFAASALVAGQIGAGAVAAVASAAAGRRVLMGMITGVGVTVGLEKLGNKNDTLHAKKDSEYFLSMLAGMKDEDKIAFLSEQIKSVTIKDEENTINLIKNQDIKQMTAGVAAGTFLASGLAGDLIKAGFGKVAELFGAGHASIEDISVNKDTHISKGTSYEDFKNINNSSNPSTVTNDLKYSHEPHSIHSETIPAESTVEAHSETLTIEKGGSIERALNEYLEKNNPEVKDRGVVAHRLFLDYMHHYIENNQEALAKAGKLGEYQEMLRTGNVNIQPGAELIMDKETGLLKEIKGEIKLLHGTDHLESVTDASEKVSNYRVIEPPENLTAAQGAQKIPVGSVAETVAPTKVGIENVDASLPQDWNQDIIDEDKMKIADLDKQHAEQGFKLQQNTEGIAFIEEAEKLSKIEKTRELVVDHMKTVIEGTHNQALRSLRENFFDSNAEKFKIFKNMKVLDAVAYEDGRLLKYLSKTSQNSISVFLNSDELKPEKAETFEKWTRRIVLTLNKSD